MATSPRRTIDGDNPRVIATDTMKNTAYALAGEHLTASIEDVRLRARPPLPRPSRRSRTVEVSIEQHRLAPDRRRARRVHPRRIGRRGPPASTVRRGRRRRSSRARRPGRDEDDPIGVLGLPARPLHDAQGDRGPDHRDEGHRVVAYAPDGAGRLRRLVRGGVDRRSSRCSPTTTRVSVQASIWIVGKAILERHPEVAETSRCRCRTSTTGRST